MTLTAVKEKQDKMSFDVGSGQLEGIASDTLAADLPTAALALKADYRRGSGHVVDDVLQAVADEVKSALSSGTTIEDIGNLAVSVATETGVLRPAKLAELVTVSIFEEAFRADRMDVLTMGLADLWEQVRDGIIGRCKHTTPEAAIWYRDALLTAALIITAHVHSVATDDDAAQGVTGIEYVHVMSLLSEQRKVLTGQEVQRLLDDVKEIVSADLSLDANQTLVVGALVVNSLQNDPLFAI